MTPRYANLAKSILSFSLAAGLLCAGVNASAQTTASVNIPFAFSADNQTVQAGHYKVELLSDRYVALRNTETNQTQILMVRPEEGTAIESRGRLTFRQDGSKKYLAQVWIAGTSMHSEVAIQHKQEQTLAHNTPDVSMIEIALK
jgi:hypothetical protein